MILASFSVLLALVEAKGKEASAVEPPAVWPWFLAAALAGLAGSYACKQAGQASLATALGACFGFAALELVDATITKPFLGMPIVVGGHAAVTAILFAAPALPAATTAYKVLGGHIVATIAGLIQLNFIPPDLATLTKTLCITLAVLGQKATDSVHPPACAFAFIFVTGNKGYEFAIGPIVGCAVLIAAQQAWLAVTASGAPAAGKKKN